MKSKPAAMLLADLGVTKTHSASIPRVERQSVRREAQFKTLKYCPQFPERFVTGSRSGRLRVWAGFALVQPGTPPQGLGFLTPASCISVFQASGPRAVATCSPPITTWQHPERFVKGRSNNRPIHDLARSWINPPAKNTAAQAPQDTDDR